MHMKKCVFTAQMAYCSKPCGSFGKAGFYYLRISSRAGEVPDDDEPDLVCNQKMVLHALRGGRIKGVRRISLQNHIF